MRNLVIVILVCSLLTATAGIGQERLAPPRLINLLANPEKFDGKVVSVRGFFLVLGGRRDMVSYFLCVSREDAENELGNSILVVPNERMQKDLEKIDRMYVILTGSVHTYPIAGGGADAVLKDITDYRVWSDPKHPILLKGDGSAKIK